MKVRQIGLIILGILIILACGETISWGSYSASNQTVKSGETFTVTVTSSTALEAYNLDLSSCSGLTFKSCFKAQGEGETVDIHNSSIGYMNISGDTTTLGTYTFQAPTVTKDTTYTVKFLIDQTTTATSTITVKAPIAEPPKENTPPTTNTAPSTNTTPSTDTPPSTNTAPSTNDVPSTNTTPSTPEVPPEPVTPTKSNNANLSNLGITPNDFTGFKAGTTSYTVNVPNEVTTIEVYAKKGQDKQTITGTGKKSLDEGSNRFTVTVTAEDGTQKAYTITVVRLAKVETNNPDVEQAPKVKLALTSLSIEGVTINEAFNPETANYTAVAESNIETLNVNAVANILDAKIEVTGATKLVEGENLVKVTVIAADGEEEREYTITVIKEAVEKAEEEEEDSNTVPVIMGSTENNHTSGGSQIPKETLLFCVGIGVTAFLGIVFAVIRYRKDQEEGEEEVGAIDFVGDISTAETFKDAAIATSKLVDTNMDLKEKSIPAKPRGRHF